MENLWRLSHLFVTVFLSNFTAYVVDPAMTDVVVGAVCGGKDECSLAIYLTGFQQAISGLGAVVMMPIIGKLSDEYGRKAMLHIPLTLAIIPLVILAWKRTTNFFYAYYALKTLTATVTEGGVICLALGYLVAAAVSIVALVYMRVFLKETSHYHHAADLDSNVEQPILRPDTESNLIISCESSKKRNFIQKIPSPHEIVCLLKSSIPFSLVACISFFNSLAEAGIHAFLLYFLKARFHFKKDQFADILLITYGGAAVSSLFLLPVLGPFIGEETILVLGMFAGFVNMFLDSIASSSLVPYATASLSIFSSLATPNLRSMASKLNGPNEQGIAQGCILGIISVAYLVSPLIYGPLSALFLSEGAPFHFPGFSIFCMGLAYLIGFFLSIWIKAISHLSRERVKGKESIVS